MNFSVGTALAMAASSYYPSHSSRAIRGGALLAWAAMAPISAFRTANTNSNVQSVHSTRSSVALNALFIDDSVHSSINDVASVSVMDSGPASSSPIINWNPLEKDISNWLSSSNSFLLASSTPDRSPTKDEIATLQKAFAAFYGTTERDVPEAYDLLTKCIGVWENTKQGGDEIAGLYRVRGDVNMVCYCYSTVIFIP